MKTKYTLAALAATLALTTPLFAQNGTWTNNAAGTWSDPLQWLDGIAADGANNTADFSTVNLTAARVVTMDASHTLGILRFSDITSGFFGWTLAPLDGSVLLTLDNGGNAPTIAVTNATTAITVPMAGTSGLTKVGPNQLTLSATNTFTGGLVINGGTLLLNDTAPTPGFTNAILPNPNDLTLGGGNINLNEPANSGNHGQRFNNLAVNAGQSFMGHARGSNAKGYYFIDGSITRSPGGTVDIPNNDTGRTQSYATNSAVPSGIILVNGVAFLTGNGFTDWYSKAAALPNVLSAAAYTASTATTLAGNANIATGVTTTTLAADTTITSLRDGSAQVTTINLGGFTLTNGGTLMSAAVTAANGLIITNGTLVGPPGQDVVVVQNGAGTLTIAATIADNGGATPLTKSAGGNLTLVSNNTYSGNTYLNAGTLQIGNGGTSGDLGSSPLVRGQAGTLIFNRSDSLSFNGGITGPIALTKNGAGTLVLGADDTYTGVTTISAGTLQVGAGASTGSISNSSSIANSGTLVFDRSTALTYSANITGNGKIVNQGSGSVTLSAAINGTSAAITNSGTGALILNGVNTFGGNSTISAGSLVLGASAAISNSPVINVGPGAKFDVSAQASDFTLNGAGPINQTLVGFGVVTGNVTVVSGSSLNPGGSIGTLSFSNNLTLAGGTVIMETSTNASSRDKVVVSGTLTLNSGSIQISVVGAPLTNGYYPLITYPAGSLVGSVANLSVSGFSQVGQIADLDDSIPGQIRLFILSATPADLVWQGGFSSDWDAIGSPNWLSGVYVQHDNVRFDDSAVNFAVSMAATLKPNLVVVSNIANPYTFTPSAAGSRITGSASLEKDGAATLILNGVNDYTGTTTIKAGVLQVGDGASNTGNIGSGNTINNSVLDFNLTDAQVVSSAISGTGQLLSSGAAGTVILSGNNSYDATTINAGTIQIGLGAGNGSLGTGPTTNNGALDFNRSGTLTYNGVISGSGSLTNRGVGTVTLGGANSYAGATVADGGILKMGNAGALGAGILIENGGAVDVNGFNLALASLDGGSGSISNSSASTTTTNMIQVTTAAAGVYSGAIVENAAGAKNALTVLGTSSLRLNGANTYTGGTYVGDTATLIVGPGATIGNGGGITLSNGTTFSMANNGSSSSFPGNNLFIPSGATATLNSSQVANGYGGNVIGDRTTTNVLIGTGSFGQAATKQFQSMTGVVQVTTGWRFSSTSLTVNGGDNATFQIDAGGTINTRNGTFTGAGVSLGALTGTGALNGAGNADGNSLYVIGAKGIDSTFSGTINGVVPRNSSIVKTGAGTLTLDGTLSYDGSTTVNNGVLKIASAANPATALDTSATLNVRSNAVLDVSERSDGTLNLGISIAQTLNGSGTIRGSLMAGPSGATINPGDTIGTLSVTNAADFGAVSTIRMEWNRTNVQTSDLIAATNAITVNGGTLIVTNVGPNLVTGDVFRLFNQAIVGTGFSSITLPVSNVLNTIEYVYETNLLAAGSSPAGTIKVLVGVPPVNTIPTNIMSSLSGSTLTLSWPTDHIGWKLQVQTNPITSGLSSNWFDVPGSTTVDTMNFTVNPANGSVFYRMVYP